MTFLEGEVSFYTLRVSITLDDDLLHLNLSPLIFRQMSEQFIMFVNTPGHVPHGSGVRESFHCLT